MGPMFQENKSKATKLIVECNINYNIQVTEVSEQAYDLIKDADILLIKE